MADGPRFSIIIATYNWSSALRVALESVRDQTVSDFEVLVVGDACTDDSEEVVQSFGDPRFRWSNLPQNCGSQWGPNNHGLDLARGKYVAYLGHDDLWWPTHLETAGEAIERDGADMVAAVALLYGPPDSGIRAVTGFFPHGVYAPRYFFPPSSMLHRRELARRIGGWRPPEQAIYSVDHDFLLRCHESGARIVSTGEITAFKFNAAWRRDSYRLRDASEQREHLARTRQDGEAFRRRELSDALRAAAEDRLVKIESPADAHSKTVDVASQRAFKGTRARLPTTAEKLADGRLRFPRCGEFAGFEWHKLETHPSHGGFRWTGPSSKSTTIIPVRIDRPLEVTLLLLAAITEDILRTARLSVNGTALDTRLAPGPDGALLWIGKLVPDRLPADDRDELRLTIAVDKTHRPLDRGDSDDRRWIGLAVGWVEIGPAS